MCQGGWSLVAAGWADGQGCSGSWDGATGDVPAGAEARAGGTPHAGGQCPAACSRSYNGGARAVALSNINFHVSAEELGEHQAGGSLRLPRREHWRASL